MVPLAAAQMSSNHFHNTWQTSLSAASTFPRGCIEKTCFLEDKTQCQRPSLWDVLKAEWRWKGRGEIRAMQLILGLSWPLMALCCMCLLLPYKAEGILEHLTLLILVKELDQGTSGQGATRKWKHSLQMSSTVMFLFLKMQGFLNLILNRTLEQPTCYSFYSPFLGSSLICRLHLCKYSAHFLKNS